MLQWKRKLALAVAMVMVFVASLGSLPVSAASTENLSLGSRQVTLSVSEEDAEEEGDWVRYYTFTPTRTGIYTLAFSNMDTDVDAYLYEGSYDGDKEALRYNSDSEIEDFKLAYKLIAGTSYTYRVRNYSEESGTTFTMAFSFKEVSPVSGIVFNSAKAAAASAFQLGSYGVDDLVYVRYSDGTLSDAIDFGSDEDENDRIYYYGETEIGEKVYLECWSSGKTYYLSNNDDRPFGKVTLKAYLADNTKISATKALTITAPAGMVSLTLGREADAKDRTIKYDESKYYSFTVPQKGRYGFKIVNKSGVSIDNDLYKIGNGNLSLYKGWSETPDTTTYDVQTVGNSAYVYFTLDKGSYILQRTNWDDDERTLTPPLQITEPSHTWGKWTTVSKATVFAKEKQVRKCLGCGQQQTRTVGSKLAPKLSFTASSLKMQKKQSTTKFRAAFVNGDSIKSITSGNKKLVTVSKVNKKAGTFKLSAKAKTGSTRVTVTLASGKKSSFKVTVQKGKVKTSGLAVSPSSKTVKKGKTVSLKASVAPVTSQQKVTYKSSNKKVATVTGSGKVKAVKKGKATITVKSGSKTKKVKITVK